MIPHGDLWALRTAAENYQRRSNPERPITQESMTMAQFPFNNEFVGTQTRIHLGDRIKVAIAAHVEVRGILRQNSDLIAHDLAEVLIGSYARDVAIWPGKDVDILGRLMAHTINSMTPTNAYGLFLRALSSYEAAGRLTRQPRSLKVDYGPDRTPSEASIRAAGVEGQWSRDDIDRIVRDAAVLAFEFSVDVVPAVAWGNHYAIPELAIDDTGVRSMAGTWQKTNPVELTELTHERNKNPQIGGAGAFVRTAKAIKQIKTHHLPDTKPSSLFYEFILHEGLKAGAITGDTWADITCSTLAYIAQRLQACVTTPVCDPVLGQPYQPIPPTGDLATCRALFEDLAAKAEFATTTHDRCQAAITWRHIFGGNARHPRVFFLPPGCRGSGAAQGAAATNVSSGGTEERSFGTR